MFVLIASGGEQPEQIRWQANMDRADARAGEVVNVRVRAEVQPGWHIYSSTTPPGGPMPTTFKVEAGGIAEPGGPVFQPKPESEYDETFQVQTEQYKGTVEFLVPLRISATASPGMETIRGTVAYQVCDPERCIPGKFEWELVMQVAAGATRAEYAEADGGGLGKGAAVKSMAVIAPAAVAVENVQGDRRDVEQAAREGLSALFLLALNMGLLSLLTPCVFPMIPITISYFTKSEEQGRAKGVANAAVYAASIIATFTILGLAVTLIVGPTGISAFAANPWVNILLAAIFVGLALNLFGFYEIFVPGSILTPLSRLSEKGGFLGTVMMGITFTLTSFTCTVPFVGAVLVTAAQGELLDPIVGMLGYSIAFAVPFFLLALFPQILSALPKAGGWMVSVKVVMGFLELAAALKFVSNVDLVWGYQKITRELFLAIWIAIAFVTAFYLLGKIRLPHERPLESVGVPRVLLSTTFLAIAFYLFTGLVGFPLGELDAFLPPVSNAAVASGLGRGRSSELSWQTDYESALAVARDRGQPLFIDFTGFACTNCRWMEKNVFPNAEVRGELERLARVQLFTDGAGDEYDRNRQFQQERFGSVALPLYVVVDAVTGEELGRLEGLTRDAAAFARFLRSSRERAGGAVANSRAPGSDFGGVE